MSTLPAAAPSTVPRRFADAVETLRLETAARGELLAAFVYDLDELRARTRRVVAALPEACRLFYAVKANPERPVLEALAGIVHGFEVSSAGEIGKVRAVDPSVPVIFGGPGKTDAELGAALDRGAALVHVESIHELHRLDRVAALRGARAPILLRINLRQPLPAATLAMGGRPTQFGIDESLVPSALAAVRRCPNLDFRGFHFHSVSNHLDPERHVQLVGLYLDLARSWASEAGLPLTTVNAGGGFGVNYADPAWSFDWHRFTGQLQVALDERGADAPRVLFEPGRFLVAACGVYAVEVMDVKTSHGRHFAVVRGGTHHFRLPASWGHSHPFSVLPVDEWRYPFLRPEVMDQPVSVVGQLCSPKDVLARDVPVDRIRAGDVVIFHLAGAYGWTISHHDFLSHPPPVHCFLGGEADRDD